MEHGFDECEFPDCGCPEARLCMARHGANDAAVALNGVPIMKGGKQTIGIYPDGLEVEECPVCGDELTRDHVHSV